MITRPQPWAALPVFTVMAVGPVERAPVRNRHCTDVVGSFPDRAGVNRWEIAASSLLSKPRAGPPPITRPGADNPARLLNRPRGKQQATNETTTSSTTPEVRPAA